MINYVELSQLQKYKLGFASLFENTYLNRYENDVITRSVRVPIMFSQNGKYYDTVSGTTIKDPMNNNDIDVNFATPIMSITVSKLLPDPELNINRTHLVTPDEGVFSPAPYTMIFTLNIATKRTSDTDKILEQILPLFRPTNSVTVNVTDVLKHECVVELEDVDLDYQEEYSRIDLGRVESTISFKTNIVLYRIPRTLPSNTSVEIELVTTRDNVLDQLIEQITP